MARSSPRVQRPTSVAVGWSAVPSSLAARSEGEQRVAVMRVGRVFGGGRELRPHMLRQRRRRKVTAVPGPATHSASGPAAPRGCDRRRDAPTAGSGATAEARTLGYVHWRAASSQCHRNDVAVADDPFRHNCRGCSRHQAANSSRSFGSNRGRVTGRRSTAVSCHRTSSSPSLTAGPRPRRTTRPSSIRATAYTTDRNT